MKHNITITFHDLDVDTERVINNLNDSLEGFELNNSTASTVDFYIDLETEIIMEKLRQLLEDLVDDSIINSVSVTIDIQIQKI